jgi:peptidoglycan/LPS O-acetylase OafA/YrhL
MSGFLVTKSLSERGNVARYIMARILRIYPALIVAVLFSTFVVGMLFTDLPIIEYLLDRRTYEYVYKNIILVIPGIPETLPGVFITANSQIVNGPLWTLPYEIKMYMLLVVIGGLFLLKPIKINIKIFNSIFLMLTTISMGFFIARYSLRTDPIDFGFNYDYFRFIAMFGSGVLLYMFRARILLSTKYSIFILIIISLSTFYRPLFVSVTYISLCYLLLYLAYIPKGFIRKFNRLGDYSYGIYIYGYPVQQSVEQIWPNLHILVYFSVSFSCTLALSILSWHFLEKKVLHFKNRKLKGTSVILEN